MTNPSVCPDPIAPTVGSRRGAGGSGGSTPSVGHDAVVPAPTVPVAVIDVVLVVVKAILFQASWHFTSPRK